ncbi:MAG: MarR family transcriptional regulator, partial [Pseudomonadota bacterium]
HPMRKCTDSLSRLTSLLWNIVHRSTLRTLDSLMPAFRRVFAEFDLTEQQWRVLRVLWESDAQPLLIIAEKTLIPSPSLVGIVDRMERDDLVKRVRTTKDRRVVQVCLTESGKALETVITPKIDALYQALQTKMDDKEWQVLYKALDTLITSQE